MILNHKTFETILNKNYIFPENSKLAVAVSGGPDSMALLMLLSN